MSDGQIERRIVTGMIVSDEFIREVSKIYDSRYIQGPALQRVAAWSMEYFDKYERAPFRDIEGIYYEKLKKGINKDLAEKIEEDILPELSEEYEQEHFNYQYLLDQTRAYFKRRNLELHIEQIRASVDEEELIQAEEIAYSYNSVAVQTEGLTFNDTEQLDSSLQRAFAEAQRPLIYYPGALGRFWNDQLVRGGFVSLLAPEKRGKTFILMDMALRANRQGCNVVFFQAGDMTETQMLRRMSSYLTRTPLKEKHCTETYFAVPDCYYNQIDECDRDDREADTKVFKKDEFKSDIDRKTLVEKFEEHPDHTPCTSRACGLWEDHGAVWLEKKKVKGPLHEHKARKKLNSLFANRKAKFKLSTHANGTLTVGEMRSLLATWERSENFVPDVIIVDYADLLEPDKGMRDYRHQLNEIWKGMRRLTEEGHCLLVTATQADADSYNMTTLQLKNFSEDKRKYSHVTAAFGLNRDPTGREKQLGILRINELVVREDEFESSRQAKVLQRLQIGRPIEGSFF